MGTKGRGRDGERGGKDGEDCDKDKTREERSEGYAKDADSEEANYSHRTFASQEYGNKEQETGEDGKAQDFDYQTILCVSAGLAGFALVAYLCFCGKTTADVVSKEIPSQQEEFVEVKVHFGAEDDVKADIVTTCEGTDTTLCKLSGTTKALEGNNSSTILVE